MSVISLVIDNRETKIKDVFSEEYVKYSNLYCGDVILYNGDTPVFVFERKTIPDLLASIKDGRYKGQKAKLAASFDACATYYIIEGCGRFECNDSVTKGVIINTLLRDKIGIFYTHDVKDTVQLLKDVYARYVKSPETYTCTSKEPNSDACAFQKTKKLTENTYINILCQVPGVSQKTALAIAKKYVSVGALVNQLGSLSHEERVVCLKNICTVDSKGNSRKIGEKIALNVLDVFFAMQV